MIAPRAGLSINRQCALLGVARSSFYYRPSAELADGGVSECVEIAFGGVSGLGNMTRSGNEIKMH
jgi:hypothetical protein